MRTLHIPLKAEYFHAIKRGDKPDEYRLQTRYWRKRLEGREYDQIEFTLGYPPRDCTERRITRPWRGYRETVITHPHFGPAPVAVFAIGANPGA